MGMTGAFDGSGDEASQLILVVAGFISSAKHWDDFSGEWVGRLKHDDLAYMHMKEFAHSTGQFSKGWRDNKPRRDCLMADLMQLITKYAYRKFGTIVVNETFKSTIPAQTQTEWHLNAYSLAGSGCAKQVNEWAREERYRSPVELVFEKGDAGSGKLHTRLIEEGYPPPIFRPKKDEWTPDGVLIPAFVPLQAADLLAYELFLEVNRILQSNRQHPPRWGYCQFDRMLGPIGVYEDEDLQRFQLMVDVTKVVDDWAVDRGFLKRDNKGRIYQEISKVQLQTFCWGIVLSPSGDKVVAPVCTAHRSSQINMTKTETSATFTCKTPDSQHELGTCSLELLRTELAQAKAFLMPPGSKIKWLRKEEEDDKKNDQAISI